MKISGKDSKMKTTKLTILVSVLILTLTAFTYAQQDQDDIWNDGPGKKVRENQRQRQRELTPERIEQILDRIAQSNPERAEELRNLQKDDPQAFENELRQMLRKAMAKRREASGERQGFRDIKGNRAGQNFEGRRSDRDGKGMPGRGKGDRPNRLGGRGDRERMREHKEEFENWLQENYPQKAVELEKLEQEDPAAYRQQLMTTVRKYGQLFRAEKENPELAEALKADIHVKDEIKAITNKIKAATTEDDKKALSAELETAVAKRFDLIIKRKQLQVNEMQKKLEELQNKVAEKQTAIKKLEEQKAAEVKSRVEALLETQEKVDWD